MVEVGLGVFCSAWKQQALLPHLHSILVSDKATHTPSRMLRSTYLHPLTHVDWVLHWPHSLSDVDYDHTSLKSSVFLLFTQAWVVD